jgi:hypothetical protein
MAIFAGWSQMQGDLKSIYNIIEAYIVPDLSMFWSIRTCSNNVYDNLQALL